ncbi:MAG: gas vesicle protein GvpG [Gemmatimonadetes bacterium]|nr:gas vesicle protein GvpG [Gemmatimonadota bacterium]
MGFLKHLLFWPVTGPTFLARFSLEKVEGAVRTELTDDASVKSDLMELQMQLELGDIDDEEYAVREAALMHRFRQVREWRERFGMATSGGLVKVAEEAEAEDAGPEDDRRPQVASSDEAQVDVTFGFDE